MDFIEKVREGYAAFGAYQTWYRVTGDLTTGRTPLVIIHGGPGCTHDYVDAFKDVAASGHAVIHYDQLGNGRSTHLPDKDPSFWTIGLFLEELNNLLDHLQISDNYAILGQSWGGMLGSEHAILQPKGLRAFIPANSPTCMRTWVSEANRLRQLLPEGVHETLLKHEQADGPERRIFVRQMGGEAIAQLVVVNHRMAAGSHVFKGAYQTWYRVTGDLTTGRTPLVIIHGGPGCTHEDRKSVV